MYSSWLRTNVELLKVEDKAASRNSDGNGLA